MAEDRDLKVKLVEFSEGVSLEARALRMLINGNKLSLSLLSTEDKSNLVAAINETYEKAAVGVSLEDVDIVVNDYFVLHPQTFVYDQNEPASRWLVTHPLDHEPDVSVIDSAGTRWVGQITYPALNQVQIDFNLPLAGKAILK